MRFVFGGRYGLEPVIGGSSSVIDARRCQCGHDESSHEHFRRGTDCGSCGRLRCRAFQQIDSSSPVRTMPAVVRVAEPGARAS